MSKKYLSIEEAAAEIGISTAELNRLREKGTIRAFADRGTWKFKEEDVEKLARSRQPDSDPDVPLMPAADAGPSSGVLDEEDVLGTQPTIISKGLSPEGGSDSDVRLIFDDAMSVPEGKSGLTPEDSDSDVKLAGGTPAAKERYRRVSDLLAFLQLMDHLAQQFLASHKSLKAAVEMLAGED